MNTFFHLATWVSKHQLISKILKSAKVFPSTILSLESNDHDGMEHFVEQHNVICVSSDKEWMSARKLALPTIKYYPQSLLSFRIPQKVQLVTLFDQRINTLVGEKKREKCFEKVLSSLEPYGYFIFDIYTPQAFDHLGKKDSQIEISDQKCSFSTWKEKKWVYECIATKFEKEPETDLYTRHDIKQWYQAFSLPHMKKLLSWFDSLQILDHKARKQSKKSDHLVVVAQKGWE